MTESSVGKFEAQMAVTRLKVIVDWLEKTCAEPRVLLFARWALGEVRASDAAADLPFLKDYPYIGRRKPAGEQLDLFRD